MAKKKHLNHSIKTHEESVVKIMNTGVEYDYENPWKTPDPQHCSGSGFIIQDQTGKNYILSNAHVVENSTYTEIQLSNEDTHYEASIKHFGHDCDLALLDVDNPKFWKKTKPLSIGNMVKHHQNIKVVGFPIGGEEISITQGIVSRIEIDEYEHGYKNLLQVQVDAAINAGNSGGPVFYKDKVVGVAFQGIEEGDGLGYMIPTPIIKHFLTEAFKNELYQGIPTPDFSVQKINNQALRKELKMKPEQTGLLITKIPPLSNAHGILQENDVLLSVEKHHLKNDGFISLPFDKHIHFSYLFHQKHFGESIKLQVLTKNGSTLEIELKLKKNSIGTTVILPYERDKPPSFYINSGVVFQPITQNYLETTSGQELIASGQIKENKMRKNNSQQYVIINSILACKKTSGYLKFSNSLVTHINNIKINNIVDVIKIIEESQSTRLVITIKNNELIVIEKMSQKEQLSLLKIKYGITSACSKDLIAYHNQYHTNSHQTMNNEESENNSDDTWHSSNEDEMEIAPELLKAINTSTRSSSTLFYKTLKQARYPEDTRHLELKNTPPPKKRKFQ